MVCVRNGLLCYLSYQELSLLSSLTRFPTWLVMTSFHCRTLNKVLLVLQTSSSTSSLETKLCYQQQSSVAQESVHKTPPPVSQGHTYGLSIKINARLYVLHVSTVGICFLVHAGVATKSTAKLVKTCSTMQLIKKKKKKRFTKCWAITFSLTCCSFTVRNGSFIAKVLHSVPCAIVQVNKYNQTHY